jgi:hypothetical protein
MPGGDMTYLMTQDPGKFGLVVEVRHNTSRKIHEPTWHCKSVDYRRIDNLKLIWELSPVGHGSHLLALLVDKLLQTRVFI